MKITLQELLERKRNDELMPHDIIAEDKSDIWFYDKELKDYFNDADDRLLFQTENNINKCFEIQSFIWYPNLSDNNISELIVRLDFLSSKIDKLLDKLN